MIKTFTLQKIEQQTISPQKGMVTFHIIDELGNSRTVVGTAALDSNEKIKSITPQHKRELPLIDTLSHLQENESFSLDFSTYNKFFNRETNKTINQEAYDNILMMTNESREAPILPRIMIIGSGLLLTLCGLILLIMNLS